MWVILQNVIIITLLLKNVKFYANWNLIIIFNDIFKKYRLSLTSK